MTGVAVALLLAAGSLVLTVRARGGRWPPDAPQERGPENRADGRRRPSPTPTAQSVRLGRRSRELELHELPLFIHQLAGLLRAGRPPHALWSDMLRLHAAATSAFSAAAVPTLESAGRAAVLGLSVPQALRGASPEQGRRSGRERVLDRMWVDLAACLEVAERSGAPLAGILEQYAAQLDAHLDGAASRETALAGPRATVVLLAWLPVVGLGLGFGLGINPLVLLTTSLPGQFALLAGVLLTLTARTWSRRLIRRAGGETR